MCVATFVALSAHPPTGRQRLVITIPVVEIMIASLVSVVMVRTISSMAAL
jgi:hypothetical protein